MTIPSVNRRTGPAPRGAQANPPGRNNGHNGHNGHGRNNRNNGQRAKNGRGHQHRDHRGDRPTQIASTRPIQQKAAVQGAVSHHGAKDGPAGMETVTFLGEPRRQAGHRAPR